MALPPSSMRQDFSVKPRVHRVASLTNQLVLWTPCLCHTRLDIGQATTHTVFTHSGNLTKALTLAW